MRRFPSLPFGIWPIFKGIFLSIVGIFLGNTEVRVPKIPKNQGVLGATGTTEEDRSMDQNYRLFAVYRGLYILYYYT